MSDIISSVIILGGLGFVFGMVLGVASRWLKVEEDPRLGQISALLPGANCGGCGFPGCAGLAAAIVEGVASPAACKPCSQANAEQIGKIMGVEIQLGPRLVARLQCAGGNKEAGDRAEYVGVPTCRAAAAVSGGPKGCPWGCLGLADCVAVCSFNAIRMNENGLPVVDPAKCTACGECVKICPKQLFVLVPEHSKIIVQCRNQLMGAKAKAHCKVACLGCGLCAKLAAPGLITMDRGRNLPVVDVSKSDLQDPKAVARCPTRAIRWVEGAQFQADPDPEKKPAEIPAGRVETPVQQG